MAGWKTVIFNLIMGIVAVAGAFDLVIEVPEETLKEFIAALGAVWATGGVLLRAVTKTPIFSKFSK